MSEETEKPRVVGVPFKPGQSGNPLGRPPGAKATKTKVLDKLTQIWIRAEASQESWYDYGLEYLLKKNGNNYTLSVGELITARAAYCLARNIKYENTSLLKEWNQRTGGKIPLRVLTRPGDEGVDDFDELTNEELKAYVEEIDRRARYEAALEEQKQLPEGEQSGKSTGPEQADQG